MSTTHVVQQGDCINTIANDAGFFWYTIWTHPNNEALRAQRTNPNILEPGDSVFVPDKRLNDVGGQTELLHTFRLKGVPVRFNVRLLDFDGEVRPKLPYTLDVDGNSIDGVSGDDGVISQIIKPASQLAKLTVRDPKLDAPENYQFQLGYLNPVDDTKGLQARLQSLGYLKAAPSGSMDDATKLALNEFQTRNHLQISGEVDSATIAALLGLHGC
jgi:Putative peptidoglycan binding domain